MLSRLMPFLLACIVAIFAAQAGAQQAADPTIALPMERVNYFIGESIPIGVQNVTGTYSVLVLDANGRAAAAGQATAPALRLDTARMAAGRYQVQINGQATGTSFTLVSPQRISNAALSDEAMPDVSKPEKFAAAEVALRESGINAVMVVGAEEVGRDQRLDLLAGTGTVAFYNPYTRPMSFIPARVYGPELQTFRHRLALSAQANGRYPTFAGYQYDWDPTGINREMLFIYWQWGTQGQPLRNYIARSTQAVYDDFTRRTGLQPVTKAEYMRYCLSIGRPEYAPAIDLPTYRWINEMAGSYTPMRERERMAMEKRLDAWSNYLMGLYAEGYAGHQQALREVMPSLRNTSSVNVGHNNIKDGQYHPSAYQPLDFRYMTAWDDQVAGPDFTYQWLYSAGLLDMARQPGQPTWIGSSLGPVHGLAAYPGRFMRMAGHNLAYHGTGLGFAMEGFSNVLGGFGTDTNWATARGKAAGEDLISGRDFLRRFAPLSTACADVRQVGVLYSKTQFARQETMAYIETPQFNAFITLARLGYTPRYITEEEIVACGLNGMKTLVVAQQTVPLPWQVMAQLDAFTQAGGRIIADDNTLVELPRMQRIKVAMAEEFKPGKPHNWSVPNRFIVDKPHAMVYEEHLAQLMPPTLLALGSTGRTPLVAKNGAKAKVSTFMLDGGKDATYIVAVNDATQSNQSDWVRISETLVPNGEVKGVLYDLTAEKNIGTVAPVTCTFDNLTARVYGLLNRPVEYIGLTADQKITAGQDLRLQVEFQDKYRLPLRAAIPCHITVLRPDKSQAMEFYRATDRKGTLELAANLGANEMPGIWTLTVRSLLDGSTASLPITVDVGAPVAVAEVTEPVIVRGREALLQLLAKKPALTLPVFDNEHQKALLPVAEAAKNALAKKGVAVTIWQNPALGTYVMGYDPSAEELAQNARAEQGSAIGQINLTTINRNDYFGAQGGYIFGKPVILLDLVGEKKADSKNRLRDVFDNPMAEKLDAQGMLWPSANTAFPGPGRATVQVVKSAFLLGVDAIIIQASDVKGLLAGVQALANPPADWLEPGVAQTRRQLLSEFGIDPQSDKVDTRGLTPRGLVAGKAPKPLAITFGDAQPPTLAEVKPFVPTVAVAQAIPAVFEPKDAVTYYNIDGSYERCWSPGGNWQGDLRFSDALKLTVDAKDGGTFNVAIDGIFRYNDRQPRSQAQWEDVLAVYNKTVKKTRQPMTFEVWVDGKLAGTLTTLQPAEKDVPIDTLPGYSTDKPKSVVEEVVTQVSGTVTIPAGTHEVMFIHRNMVDGNLTQIALAQ